MNKLKISIKKHEHLMFLRMKVGEDRAVEFYDYNF